MSTQKSKGPIVDPGLCRCCGSIKRCRLLNVEYEWMGQKEVYSDIFVDTFGLLLSNLESAPEDKLICATCVTRLRDASAFRKQVLGCEERLLNASIKVYKSKDETGESVKDENCSVNELEATDAVKDSEPCEDYLGQDDDVAEETKQTPEAEETHQVTEDAETKRLSEETKPKKTAKKPKRSSKKEKSREKRMLTKEMSCQMDAAKILERMDSVAEQLDFLQLRNPQLKKEKKVENNFHKFLNTVAIVENSYVCPFDTSFSDYFCIYCREVFVDPSKLREHTMTHDSSTFKHSVSKNLLQIDITRIDCRLCPELINDIDQLKVHLTNAHSIQIHEVTNEFLKFKLTANNLTCLECGCTFNYFHALKKHMAEHFGKWICDICGARYFKERIFNLHQQKKHGDMKELFPCKMCGKVFRCRQNRNVHELKMHKKEPTFECHKCDAVLFSYALRQRHMIDVHGEQRLYKCNHCERTYDSRKSLREHNRRIHLKVFKHQCDLCDRRFYIPSRLKEHMITHTGERNFRCEYCGKSYPRLRGLRVHMQSHSTEKKYRCTMCNASFTQNVNLKNHIKRQHPSLSAEFQE